MMNRKRLLFWTAFLGGAGLIAVGPDLIKTAAPAPEATAAREPAAATHAAVGKHAAAPSVPPLAVVALATPTATLPSAASIGNLSPAPAPAPAPADAAAAAAPAPELFAVKSWVRPPPPPPPAPPAPPPPPPAPPPPPPPPTAPPLPFSFMGRIEAEVGTKVFLLRGERLYSVGTGETIDGQYRVEKIDASQMVLVYLPLNQKQSLNFGKS